ncbi:MAG: toxic anion resistance protein, partial [Candidatus Paceibacterota bacterium]
LNQPSQRVQMEAAVESIGAPLVKGLLAKSGLLNRQVGKLATTTEGRPVAKSLIDLKVQVDHINPARYNILAPGAFGRVLSYIPFVGITANRYFTKYQSASGVIEAIVFQMREGAAQLQRDNDFLSEDQAEMRSLILRLQKTVQVARRLDDKLAEKIASIDPESEKCKFLNEEVLFPLRQRIVDLQQNLLINQNGVIVFEVIRRTNRELIRGVRRCEEVTVNALRIGAAASIALADQRVILKSLEAMDETANEMLVQMGQLVKTGVADVNKRASGQSLSLDKLKTCFADVVSAVDDISRFKQEALPQMAQNIAEMDRMAGEGEKVIGRMERGNAQRSTISLELEPSGAPLNA